MRDFPDISSWHYRIDKAVVTSVTIFVAFVAKRFIEGAKSKLAFKDETEKQRVARMGNTWSAIYKFEAAADDLLRVHKTQVKVAPMAIDVSKPKSLEARGDLAKGSKPSEFPPAPTPPTQPQVPAILLTDRTAAEFNKITPAYEPVFVTALVNAGMMDRSVVCAYASKNKADLRKKDRNPRLRASTAVHYGFETDNQEGSLSMLVQQGEFWLVDHCDNEDPLSSRPSVYTQKIEVSLK